ncbi:lipase family protein [Mesorhizobium sp. PAMC28654]|uniref:alpha/beta fold hydrolase n=1 Tax=Mesorhizobium sp. PAMC28654 TaxID=2880934 RepID=UPI001D0A4A74|nr:alpha/beta fold hydrolase [Mesorhizobium sp. PAMC28654]UDL89216.1 lipase family protein [Mesorhizobium sp. PAMC28654]
MSTRISIRPQADIIHGGRDAAFPAGQVLAGLFLAVAMLIAAAFTTGRAQASDLPGSLVSAQRMSGAPDGSTAYRIIYMSTGLSGEPIPVSGVVVVPAGHIPTGGRPIVAWAHPTTGVEPQCGPSRARVFFSSVQGLRDALARGYVVTATDYPGLGIDRAGPHPYLVGTSEGRAVLDSVRAARQIPDAGASDNFAVWGHSQGGHAALYSGLLASAYAPELHLVGVAAAAPATELAELMREDQGTGGGNNITAMTLWSWSRVYVAPIDHVVMPRALPVVNKLAGKCIERWFDVLDRRGPTRALEHSFLSVNDLSDLQPWKHLLADNTPGPLPSRIPVFIAQGTKDNLVRPSVTMAYVKGLCRRGSKVELERLKGVGHAFAARHSASDAMAWIAGRFAGAPAPSNCGNS